MIDNKEKIGSPKSDLFYSIDQAVVGGDFEFLSDLVRLQTAEKHFKIYKRLQEISQICVYSSMFSQQIEEIAGDTLILVKYNDLEPNELIEFCRMSHKYFPDEFDEMNQNTSMPEEDLFDQLGRILNSSEEARKIIFELARGKIRIASDMFFTINEPIDRWILADFMDRIIYATARDSLSNGSQKQKGIEAMNNISLRSSSPERRRYITQRLMNELGVSN